MTEEGDEPPRRGRLRPGWVLGAVVAAVAMTAGAILAVQRGNDDPGDFAKVVADALAQGGDERFRSVFCESTPLRSSGVDVFALVRPTKVTVDTVVEKDDANAMAVLAVEKANDRVWISMDKQPDWCVDEIALCTTAAEPRISPPALPCDGLLGRD
ncbi:hypothetical protein HNP84_003701 [Thermocatellispora tengchongensis]|uniref:Uncharacterized protein n=1 Tax=Thermocatellispora tengchongensis TaxID=1073253 RepID=A0A840PD65_9ACTN|nr:hypothetical protein [Thermocatellispora tengchongensis]MBB5133975.1 hypothetical protein [Thermocatellispora tengchongensis]